MKNTKKYLFLIIMLGFLMVSCDHIQIVEDESELDIEKNIEEIRAGQDKKAELTGKYTDKKTIGTAVPSGDTSAISTLQNSSKGRVNAESLNLRERADVNSRKIGSLKENDLVEIIGEENNWYKIRHGSLEAYVLRNYISVSTTNIAEEFDSQEDQFSEERESQVNEERNTDTAASKNYYVDVDVLNVRVYANEEAELKDKIVRDTRVEIILDTDLTGSKWVKIQYDGGSGYVVKEYLRK